MDILTDKIQTSHLLDNQLVIDIETTGVDRSLSYIQVVGLLSNKGLNFMQLTAKDHEEEKILLQKLRSELQGKDIISYNGINFDLPFIKARMAFYNIEVPEINSHFDIFNYLIENRFFFSTESFALQAMEEILSIERFENFEKSSDREFYNSIHNEKFARICLHNKYDVINTERLLAFTNDLRRKRTLPFYYGQDLVSSYIEAININKNICKVRISASQDSNLNYLKDLKSLKWQDKNVLITFPIIEGFIAKGHLGHVYIQDSYPLIEDSSNFNLDKRILLIYHNRKIELENVKNIILKLIDEFLS
ncbi:MAG: ribonuclease H-like domain-containing protein [Tissierellia bacterium]|nr:ribonuclease H-like domain-containing protein [Tissierellia bacterium]